jgi:hypothetical protein
MIDPARIARMPRAQRIAGLSLLVIFLLFEFLNFTGFCYREVRYPSDKELLDAAVRRLMSESKLMGDDPIEYDSPEKLFQENPNCCSISRWGHQFSYPIGFRILGFYESIAQVAYKFSSRGPLPVIEAYISMNACGKTFEVTSFRQPSGPQTK